MSERTMAGEAGRLLARVDADEQLRRRVVQDALQQATGAFWKRRAEAFEAAVSRPGDFLGRATPAQVAERDARIRATAIACRAKADLLIGGWLDE